jgi:type I restriction enzyme R subunit
MARRDQKQHAHGRDGWETVSAVEEIIGASGTLGRETSAEVVLALRLRAALARLNPAASPEALTLAVDALTRNRSAMSLVAANRDIYDLVKDGIALSVPDHEHGGQKAERIKVIDWLNPKPMRNHTLMQTIARANRVFPGKHSGLIVDYANVFASLERALAIYGKGRVGTTPVRDKQQLVEELAQAIATTEAFCVTHSVHLATIEALTAGSLERLSAVADAVDRLISPDPLRKDFLTQARWVTTLYQAIKPDPAVVGFAPRVSTVRVIADTIRERTGEEPADITAVMAGINALLDESIAADGFHIREEAPAYGGGIDISAINFEALAKRFAKTTRKNVELEALRRAVRAQLEGLIRANHTRTDFLTKFEELIQSYNAGSRNIDDLFRELLALGRALSEEEQRHVREQLTEDELTVFDLLTRPGPELTPAERDEVKKVARQLLTRVRAALVLNWREKMQARAQVRLAIEDALDEGLPRTYTPDIYQQKCGVVFEHVFERFGDYHEDRASSFGPEPTPNMS